MRNIKLTIEYDGTNYCGWQIQKNALSIQEVVEKAISNLVMNKVDIIGSSRTDAKVHARGMVANFFTDCSIPVSNFPAAINGKLPEDIVIINAEEASLDFHSRYSCTGKRYSYTILNRREHSALLRNYTSHIRLPLDVSLMRHASCQFIGTYDFSAFKSTGSSTKTSVRTIKLLDINRNEDIIKICIEADGFLYNMVRIITGTLIEVGMGKLSSDSISSIIESGDRDRAGKTAPPQGLCLERVYY